LCLTRSSIPTAHYPPSTQTSTLSLHDALPICEMEVSNTIAKSQTSFFVGNHTATLGGQYKYENLTDNGNELQSRADLRRLTRWRSEEHTSELQSRFDIVCRLLLEKKNN